MAFPWGGEAQLWRAGDQKGKRLPVSIYVKCWTVSGVLNIDRLEDPRRGRRENLRWTIPTTFKSFSGSVVASQRSWKF